MDEIKHELNWRENSWLLERTTTTTKNVPDSEKEQKNY